MKTICLLISLIFIHFTKAADIEVRFAKSMAVHYEADSGNKIVILADAGHLTDLTFVSVEEDIHFLAKKQAIANSLIFEDKFHNFLNSQSGLPMPVRFKLSTDASVSLNVTVSKKPVAPVDVVALRPAGAPVTVSPPAVPPTDPEVTGSMIKDALTLASLTDNAKINGFKIKLVSFYGITTPENPFRNEFNVVGMVGLLGGFNPISAIGGLDVTNLADGLARFFVKRTKQELNAAFFNHLKEVLDDPRYLDLKLVFPQTHSTLQALGDEIYNYEAYLGTLKESFEQDLRSLPPHLQSWLYEGTLREHLKTHKEVRAGAYSALYFYDQLSNDVHPGTAIADFPVDSLADLNNISLNGDNLIVKGAAETFIELSKSLWSGNNDRYWVSSDTLKLFSKNEQAQKYYLGMLFEKIKNIKIKTGTAADNITTMGGLVIKWNTSFATELKPRLDQFKFFIQQTQQLEQKLKLVKKDGISDSLRSERYFVFFEQFTATLKAGYDLSQKWLPIPDTEKSKFERLLFVSDQVSKLGLNVSRRKYGSAIIHAIGIYDFLSEKTTEAETIKIDGTDVKLKENSKSVVSEFLRYGSMIAAVAEANNSQEVADAIEAFALPAGSSGVKRKSAFNVALNGYTGVLAGHESGTRSPYINSYAVWAPVGISVSAGRISFGNWKNHSFSLFASFIDIGAVTAFRFKDDTTVTISKIQLKDIIAPGAAISWGIAKTPLSLAIGWQSAPFLRTVTTEENTTLDYRASRWHVTLAVDIPLLNFYNRKNRKK